MANSGKIIRKRKQKWLWCVKIQNNTFNNRSTFTSNNFRLQMRVSDCRRFTVILFLKINDQNLNN